MNKILIICASLLLATVVQAYTYDYAEGEKSSDQFSYELQSAASTLVGESAAPMLHAVKLQMAKYDRDMKTPSGRIAWHGKLIGQEIYTNDLVKIEIYSNEVDGAVWRYKMQFKPIAPKSITYKAPTMTTNGVPARLAAARARRNAEITNGVQSVTIVVTAVDNK